jgi:predicted nucleic acid-binding Zn ribbon protein
MSENRICPVCEKEIPEDARICPHSDFELENLNDEEAIERRKKGNKLRKYYILAGPLFGLLLGLFIALQPQVGHEYEGWRFFYATFAFVLGLLAGFICYLLLR